MSLMRMGIALVAVAKLAQPQTLTFEVASIKPSGPKSVRGSEGGPGSSDPSRYSFGRAQLLDFIGIAYDIDPFQISSREPLDREEFDLVAKVPEVATKEQFRAMLQNFLTERFHLKLHMESRDFQGYELVVAKSGAKLAQPIHPEEGFPNLPSDRPGIAWRQSTREGYVLVRLTARQQPISALARMLLRSEQTPVVDRTGISGRYDFLLEYSRQGLNAPQEGTAEPPPPPSLPTALQSQLGLQIVQKKLSFEVLIVDSFDRVPTEN